MGEREREGCRREGIFQSFPRTADSKVPASPPFLLIVLCRGGSESRVKCEEGPFFHGRPPPLPFGGLHSPVSNERGLSLARLLPRRRRRLRLVVPLPQLFLLSCFCAANSAFRHHLIDNSTVVQQGPRRPEIGPSLAPLPRQQHAFFPFRCPSFVSEKNWMKLRKRGRRSLYISYFVSLFSLPNMKPFSGSRNRENLFCSVCSGLRAKATFEGFALVLELCMTVSPRSYKPLKAGV